MNPAAPFDATARPHDPRQALGPLLRLLWNQRPAVLAAGDDPQARTHLSPQGLHLPPRAPTLDAATATLLDRARAVHATAHLVYSCTAFDPQGLDPLARCLVGLLEDARVEALACRELPGLRRLWAPWHDLQPAAEDPLERLLLRLSRALFEADPEDPHPWIARARARVFLDRDVLALRRPVEVRRAALQLAGELADQRLSPDAVPVVVGPAYRDDNRWLWRDAGAARHAPWDDPDEAPRPGIRRAPRVPPPGPRPEGGPAEGPGRG